MPRWVTSIRAARGAKLFRLSVLMVHRCSRRIGRHFDMNAHNRGIVLTLSRPDAVGIVAAVTNELVEHGALIAEAHHYRESVSNRTNLRSVFETGGTAALDMKG